MAIQMTAQEFISEFPHPDDAIDYILSCDKKGLVYVAENTLPIYHLKSDGSLATPLWGSGNTHSVEVRIERYYEDDDVCADGVVTFRFGEELNVFYNRLSHDLDGVTEESEMHWQDNPQAHRLRERDALALQININQRRIGRLRRYFTDKNDELNEQEFIETCKIIAKLDTFNTKAFGRIEELGY